MQIKIRQKQPNRSNNVKKAIIEWPILFKAKSINEPVNKYKILEKVFLNFKVSCSRKIIKKHKININDGSKTMIRYAKIACINAYNLYKQGYLDLNL